MDRRRPLLPGRQGRRASEAGRARPCRARAWGPPAHRGGPRHGRRRQGRAARHAVCPRAAAGLRPRGAGGGRRDLTALPTFTIDPDTARDFDDAISVARDGEGYRAHVHIADVSYFVDDDGAIERAARRRTSSAYLPLFAEPMLPGALSSDLCSLVPRQPRKCVTVEFAFAANGRRTAVEFYRSLISSDHRLTYGFVDTVIGAATEVAAPEAASCSTRWRGSACRRRRFRRSRPCRRRSWRRLSGASAGPSPRPARARAAACAPGRRCSCAP